MGIFGKSDPGVPPRRSPADKNKTLVQEWSRKLRKEGHALDRQINHIRREEAKVTKSIKECGKKNDMASAKVLARELVRSHKTVNRLYTTKANLNSVEMSMKTQAAQIRIAGEFKVSTEVMQTVQNLVKVPEMNRVMLELSREMSKAGLIEEIMDESIDSALSSAVDDDVFDDEVQKEIDKIVSGVNLDKQVNTTVAESRARKNLASIQDAEEEEESKISSQDSVEVDKDIDEMQERLKALKT